MREFLSHWRTWGWRVAVHNVAWRWVHRHDDHVRAWQDGEQCSGCERCP